METNQNFKIERVFEVNDKMASEISNEMDEGTSWDVEQGKLFLGSKDNALFLAFVDGVVVGFLSANRLQRFDARKAEVLLYEITVNENHRNKGIGKALIAKVKEWAKEVGADEVWVLTNEENLPAMAMYRGAGGELDEPASRMFTYKV